ncbi:oligosaccharyl transferase, archaeosortase A system-associated [Halomicroarcula sp. GCM10025817]|uniref:oligosaccharyl transferase, archaeosortase A system-associated n=1 Tax=Haloarcula TaxID=2237 RepID=UPI0023E7F33F|nr:oligosaccharyl transferase, archaeosortase A system-associated [Halomicroarcula sp. SYNS111]
MSQSSGYFDDNPELDAALDWAERWYHVPILLVMVGFMLWNRVQNWRRFVVDGEVLFRGNDPFYHFRSTMYVVRNWPATMPFDPWTRFPIGNRSGQFGTLMDQVVGTVALVLGLGSPSEGTVAMTALFAPAVMGTLAAIPTYYVGKRLGGRIGGVTAVVVLALSAGTFTQRSLVGVYDHQVAEGLLQVTAVLGVMVALSVAERDRPIYEQFVERDVASLRDTVGWSVLAGFGVAIYLWTWPPAVLLIGILGAFFLFRLVVEFWRGQSPEHTAIVGAVTMGTVGVLTLASLQKFGLTATDHSVLQPLLAFAVAFGCVFMAWLARYVEAESLDRNLYPVTVFGIIAVGAILMAILLPDVFSYFVDQVLRVVGFTASPSATQTSVGEAQPLQNPSSLYNEYGLALLLAIIGALYVLFQQLFGSRRSAEEFLVVVWTAIIFAATLTQLRFGVYAVFPIATLTGLVVGKAVDWIDLSAADGVDTYQVLAVITIVFVVVGPLVFVTPTALDYGSTANPGDGIQGWDQNLEWMQGNTPEEGAYGVGGNRSLEYYGTYQIQDDFDYSEGEYGVISWWDYGHWITTQAERIPNANPFQQGSDLAANFLLAPTEEQANSVLDGIDEDDAHTRYVAVDWKMTQVAAGPGFQGKFFAPPRFEDQYNTTATDYYRAIQVQQNGQVTNQRFYYRSQDYYDTTVVRLYEFHGSAVQPQPFVVDWDRETVNGRTFRVTPADGRTLKQFPNMSAARQFVREDGTAQVGGFGTNPGERVPAMEHYRYVGSSSMTGYESSAHNRATLIEAQSIGLRLRQASTCTANETSMPLEGVNYCMPDAGADLMNANTPAWTKTFERVPGATIEGTGPANTTVTAAVRMHNEQTNETFVYRQQTQTDASGDFEMTVPYSTTGYDEWGTEAGYTNVSVRAETSYQLTATGAQNGVQMPFAATTNVTEGQVIGENESASTVELEPAFEIQTNDTQSENETAGNATTDDGEQTTTNETSGSDTSTNASSSLAPISGERSVVAP